jgi:hypothetical protein
MSRSSPYPHYGNNNNQSVQPYHRNRSDGNTRAINGGGDGGDRRSMAGSGGYRGGYRSGGGGQRFNVGGAGRYQPNQNAGNNFNARPGGLFWFCFELFAIRILTLGGNRYLGRSGGARGAAVVGTGKGGQRFPHSNKDTQRSVDCEDGSSLLEQKQLPPQNRRDSASDGIYY